MNPQSRGELTGVRAAYPERRRRPHGRISEGRVVLGVVLLAAGMILAILIPPLVAFLGKVPTALE